MIYEIGFPTGEPPAAGRPLWARLTAPPGPAVARLVRGDGAAVLVVPGRYSVTYLVLGADAILAVDCGSNDDLDGVLAALDWLGRPRSDLKYVMPTHLHMDHMMGLDALARETGASVLLGRVAREHVTTGRTLRWPPSWALIRALGTYFQQGAPRPARSDMRDGLDFGFPWAKNQFGAPLGPALDHGAALPDLPGWVLLSTPGHADDAICLYHRQARFLVTGDMVRNFLGGEWNPLLADREQYRRSQDLLRTLEVETIFPGHGPVVESPDLVERLRAYPFFIP